nr:MAG TPA: Tungsten formylmethanofuran dehydrogenase subunit E/gapdh domain-like fold, structural genomics.9A [Caudoviricetes sp.]
MYYTDDPVTDFLRHDYETEKKVNKLPVCECCGEHIQDGYYYEINDEPICENCLNDHYRREVDIDVDGY